MTPPPPQDRGGFEVALICALRIEADAVHLIFDKFWDDDGINYGQSRGDRNSYVTGAIGEHNVVLAQMPGMGKVSASAVSTGLLSSFPSIKIVLLVGICGGVPFGEDQRTRIFLGDLIVSTALTQYDFGRQYPNTHESKDTLEDRLGRSDPRLRAYLEKLQTARYRRILQNNIATCLESLKQAIPTLHYPGYEHDHLYNSTYVHQHHTSTNGHRCDTCNEITGDICETALKLDCTRLGCVEARRTTREGTTTNQQGYAPQVYFGRVGSGDTVMKSGLHRDKIAKRDNIIAFEMEGAGVWDQLPCVVLKSVCDYADSHKNKNWQTWAATVAAAGAKAFLKMWQPRENVTALGRRRRRGFNDENDDSGLENEKFDDCIITSPSTSSKAAVKRQQLNRLLPTSSGLYDDAILASLSFEHMLERRNNVESPYGQTCQWILHNAKYQDWTVQRSGLLWIKGKPGAGKSTLMSFLYDVLRNEQHLEQYVHLEFFFSARGNELQHSPLGMLRSLINQIFRQSPSIRDVIRTAYQEKEMTFGRGDMNWKWQKKELEGLLIKAVIQSAQERPLMIFVDALDEAGENNAREMAHFFHNMHDQIRSALAKVSICISCRHHPIVSRVRGIEICVEHNNDVDIAAFVRDRLQVQNMSLDDMAYDKSWRSIADYLIDRARGVFQWVRLVIPMVEKALDDGESLTSVRQRLQRVPDELGEIYEHIINNVIDPQYRPKSFLLFQWVCLAERPLSVTELRFALAAGHTASLPLHVRVHDTEGFITEDERMRRQIHAWSGGLVEVVGNDGQSEVNRTGNRTASVQVIHQSVNDFLVSGGLLLLMKDQTPVPGTTMDHEPTTEAFDAICVGHANLYRSCLHYLLREGNVAVKDIEAMLPNLYNNSYHRPIDSLSSAPFVEYAATNLFLHAKRAIDQRSENVEEEAQSLKSIIACMHPIYLAFHGTDYVAFGNYDHKDERFFNFGTTLLHVAAAAGLIDVVRYLVDIGVDVNVQDNRGYSAIHYAAKEGHLPIVDRLVHAGSRFDTTTRDGETALVLAAGSGHLELVEWIVERDMSLNRSNSNGDVLIAAAEGGSLAVVRLLLGAGADVNAQGTGGFGFASIAASEYGEKEVVQLLLDRGAEVNIQGGQRGTALQAACFSGNEEVVQLLLDHGADVNIQGGAYGTALQVACYSGRKEVVQLLLDHGADVNIQGGHYGTVLQAACCSGRKEVVQLLLDLGVDVNIQGGLYKTALQAACFSGRKEVVQLLLDRGVDVNVQGGYYRTALQAACNYGNKGIVQLLLDYGADVNVQGGHYGSALQAASYWDYAEIVQLLLDHGAIP